MKTTVWMFSAVALAGTSALCCRAAAAVDNLDFEKGTETWRMPSKGTTWSVREGAGRNGSKALFFDRAASDTNAYEIVSKAIPFKPGQSLLVTGWLRNISLPPGKNPGFCVEYFDAKGGYLGGAGSKRCPGFGNAGEHDWQQWQVELPTIPANARRVSIDLMVSRGVTGQAAYDNFESTVVGWNRKAELYSNAERNAAYDGKVRFYASTSVDLSRFKDREWEASFRIEGEKGVKSIKPLFFENGFAEALVDVAEFRRGVGKVEFRVETTAKKRETLDSATTSFTRLEKPREAVVRFDAKRRMVLDGKKVFPLLVYVHGEGRRHTVDRPRLMEFLAKSPFRMVMDYDRDMDRASLDAYHRAGIRAFVSFCSSWGGGYCAPRGVCGDGDGAAFTARKVLDLRDHPALLGWYLYDEPEDARMIAVRDRRSLVDALDPEHVTLTVLCHGRLAHRAQQTCDVVGLDCYPVPGNGTAESKPANLGRAYEECRTAIGGMRGEKPFWFVPQSFENTDGRHRFPTYDEMNSMVWQALIAGADGMLFYSLGEMLSNPVNESYTPEKGWEITCRVAQGIRDREAYLLSDEPAPKVEVACAKEKAVAARAWRAGGKTLVVACNLLKTPVEAEIAADGFKEKITLGYGGTFFKLKVDSGKMD